MRSNRPLKISLTCLVTAGLAACTSTPALDDTSADFGDAIAHNIAAQRVAPSAEQKANTYIKPNRARQKAAREAYEKGETPEPAQLGTTGDE